MVSSSLPMLKECCCGCSLKTGSMIIGFITLVWACLLTFIAAMSLSSGNYVIIVEDSELDTVLQTVVLAVRAIQAFFSLVLIIATHREQAALIVPWLVVSLVAVAVEGTSLAIMVSQLAIGLLNPRIFSMATHVSVTVYFFFVVFSFYRAIKNNYNTTSKA